ncbi:MAG: extracellular solute-binding protein [Planctomycetaceae bacterium]|nr:extracellular solute-binding protein [Planctomycetaceae bacterium]
MRSNSLLFIAAWMGVSLAGCPGSCDKAGENRPAELPFAGQSVGIAVPAGLDFLRQWEGPLVEWGAQTGAQVDLVEYQPGDESTLQSELTESGRTIIIFPLERLGELIEADLLAPIPASILNEVQGVYWLDLFSGLRDGPASPRKRPTLVPVLCPVLVCYYRQDLLEKARLKPPQTWDDYQKLLDMLADWAPGLDAVEPWSREFCATMFLARSAAFAKHPGHFSLFFEIDSGKPLIDGPGFVRGLESARVAAGRLARESRQLSPTECRDRVVNGQAALAIGFEPARSDDPPAGEADSTAAAGRPEDAQIGICRLPGSREVYNPTRHTWEPLADKRINQVTLCGFSGLAAAAAAGRSPSQLEAGWSAISRLGSQGFASGFPSGAVGLCRESQVASSAYCDAVAQSLRDAGVVLELPIVRRRDFREALTAAVLGVLDDRATPEAALNAAAASWTKLVDEIGPERVKNNYRAVLGLSTPGGKR